MTKVWTEITSFIILRIMMEPELCWPLATNDEVSFGYVNTEYLKMSIKNYSPYHLTKNYQWLKIVHMIVVNQSSSSFTSLDSVDYVNFQCASWYNFSKFFYQNKSEGSIFVLKIAFFLCAIKFLVPFMSCVGSCHLLS